MTPSAPTPVPPAKPRRRKPGRRILIPCVPWEMYEGLLKVFERKRNLRLAYDNEELEIMVPSFEHEGDAAVLGALLAILAEELGLPLCLGGSTTLKRKRMLKGIESDRCFWVTNAAKLAGVQKLDLKIHPPPDIAIEVDVTSSSLNRFRIYAALGVGELWRLDGDDLRFHTRAGKRYTEVPTSPTFAGITPADLMPFVKQARGVGDHTVVTKAFRAWVKQRVAAAAAPPAPPTAP